MLIGAERIKIVGSKLLSDMWSSLSDHGSVLGAVGLVRGRVWPTRCMARRASSTIVENSNASACLPTCSFNAVGLVVDQTEAFFWNGEVWSWSECHVIPAWRWAEPVLVYSEMAARESSCSLCVTKTAGSQLPLDVQTRSRNSSGILLARRFNLLKINK